MVDVLDPLIGRLMKCLLEGTSETSPEFRQLTACCLGEITAIDPGRLDITMKPPLQAELRADEMACQLINDYLVPAFRAATDTRGQDRIAYAIQEILKYLGCSHQDALPCLSTPYAGKDEDDSSLSPKARTALALWHRFPEDVREITHPFLSSKVFSLSLSASFLSS